MANKTNAIPEVPKKMEPGHDGRPRRLKIVKNVSDPETRARAVAERNINHCTICRLEHYRHINELQRMAAEKLQDDAALAGITVMPGQSYNVGSRSAGPAEVAQMKIDADRRRIAALLAVGRSGRFLLEKIVIEDWKLEHVAAVMRVKKNAVLPALRVTLDALASHYGIMLTSSKRSSRIRTLHPFNAV